MWARIRALWIPTSDIAFRRSEDRLLSSAGTTVRTYEVEIRPGVAIHTAEPVVDGEGRNDGPIHPQITSHTITHS